MVFLTGCDTDISGNSNNQIESSVDVSRMVIQIFADNAMILTENGDLWLWGGNESGQLGNGTNERIEIPQKVMQNVDSVEAGGFFLAVKKNGDLWTWGTNNQGELGNGTTVSINLPQKIMDGVIEVKKGNANAIALKEDGEVWAWGRNSRGFLGNGTYTDSSTPIYVMDDVKSIYTCSGTAYAIKNNGELWAWGDNENNKVAEGLDKEVLSPVKIMDDIKKVISGESNESVYVIKDNGELWGWGKNDYGQMGNGKSEDYFKPSKILDSVNDVKAGGTGCLALKENGELWIWGQNSALLVSEESPIEKPQKVMDEVKSITNTTILKNNGELLKCKIKPINGKNEIISEKIMDGIKLYSCGIDYCIALTSENKLVIWDNEELIPRELTLDGKTPYPIIK